MATTMISDTEQKLLEPVANAVGFERSGHFYEREHEHMSAWGQLDDGDLLRLTVAAPSFNLHRITDSAFGSSQQNLNIRCAYMRASFAQVVVKTVVDSPLAGDPHGVLETLAVGECQK